MPMDLNASIITGNVMLNTRTFTPLLLLVFCLMAGCAGTKKAAKAPHPLSGNWAYSLDTPQGTFTGVMTFAEAESMLSGTITGDEQPGQTAQLEDITFDGDMSEVKFKFDGGEYGTMTVSSVLDGDKLDGLLNVGAYGVDVALTASRKMP